MNHMAFHTVFSISDRIFRQKWFYLSAAATVFCLWMELDADAIRSKTDSFLLLSAALSGRGSRLSLPLLASLPFSANAWQEISSRAAYSCVFRCGYRPYLAGQLAALFLAACLSQLLGILFFLFLLVCLGAPLPLSAMTPFLPAGTQTSLLTELSSRLLAAISFAYLGCIGAILTRDAVCALVIPTAVSFSLSLLAERFFPALADMPSESAVPFALARLAVPFFCIVTNGFFLYREVRRHA